MYTVNYYDGKVPYDVHKAAYDYLQTRKWHAASRCVPGNDIYPLANGYLDDLAPYAIKKTIYRTVFGNSEETLRAHAPISNLFDYLNETLFDNKFEVKGKPLGAPAQDFHYNEMDDYKAEQVDAGFTSYMQAQPFETIKRTRIPHRDWDDTSLTGNDGYYTLIFVANPKWLPEWHAEMLFYKDANADIAGMKYEDLLQHHGTGIGWLQTFVSNVPGRVILHDSRALHTSKPSAAAAIELSQRIAFRVKLKEGETLV